MMASSLGHALIRHLQHSTTAVGVFDGRGRLVDQNPAFARLVDGDPADAFVAPALSAILHDPDGCPNRVTLRVGQNDASWLCHAFREGEHVIVVADQDLQDIQQVLDAVLKHNEVILDLQRDLRQEVARRQAAEQARMAAALRARRLAELESWSKLKMELVRKVAHELRTPLTPLNLQLDLLRRELDHAGVEAKSLPKVLAASQRLTRAVEAMDRLAGRHAEAAVGAAQSVDIAAIVRQLVDAYADDARNRGIDLHASAKACTAQCHARAVKDILEILLENALRFGKRGGHVRVACGAQETAWVTVEDDGRGIPREQMDRIFEPLAQIHDEDDMTDLGLGTSLAYARLAAQAMQGTLGAASPGLGRGATFTLRLPVAAEG